MPYYNGANGIYFSSMPQDDIIVTDEQIATLQSSLATAKQNNVILTKIAELESKQHRAIRDAIINQDNTYILNINNEISILRTQLGAIK